MKPRRKPIKGETLFRRGYNATEIHPVVVTKSGRKYFSVSHADGKHRTESEHHIDTWRENTNGYVQEWSLYESEQEYAEEMEHRELAFELSYRFTFSHLSLSKLRRIKAITEEF